MDNTSLVWIVVIIVIIFGTVMLQARNGRNRVVSFLEQKGFQQIKVELINTTSNRIAITTATFEAEYYNKDGVLHKNTCVINTGMSSDKKIYWEKPLE